MSRNQSGRSLAGGTVSATGVTGAAGGADGAAAMSRNQSGRSLAGGAAGGADGAAGGAGGAAAMSRNQSGRSPADRESSGDAVIDGSSWRSQAGSSSPRDAVCGEGDACAALSIGSSRSHAGRSTGSIDSSTAPDAGGKVLPAGCSGDSSDPWSSCSPINHDGASMSLPVPVCGTSPGSPANVKGGGSVPASSSGGTIVARSD